MKRMFLATVFSLIFCLSAMAQNIGLATYTYKAASGVNCNATGDLAVMPVYGPAPGYTGSVKIQGVTVVLTSGAGGTLAAGVFTAASAGGLAIAANAAVSLVNLGYNSANRVASLATANTSIINSNVFGVPSNLFLNAGTAAAQACTLDVWLTIIPIPGE